MTQSGSGEEPYITPQNADQQAARIAATRGVSVSEVEALIKANTTGRDIGFLGEPGVNTTTLNIALDQKYPSSDTSTTAFDTGHQRQLTRRTRTSPAPDAAREAAPGHRPSTGWENRP